VDRVWRALAARDRAIVREASSSGVLVLCFFEETRDHVRVLLSRAGGAAASASVQLVADARRLSGHTHVLLAECHPLPQENRALLQRLRDALPGVVPVCFSALDEPMMKRLGGERTMQLLDALGLEPDEAIEHAMVTRALANARDKIAARVGTGPSQRARSMEEWLRLNVRDDVR
jgi:hypothetical protein